MIDFTTELGIQAAKRLKEEYLVWLTTVSPNGRPQPNPVWFYWDEESIIIYSQPKSRKLMNIIRNPKVSLNFREDDRGNIVIFTGEASINRNPKHDPMYLEKYREEIPKIPEKTPEGFAASYSVQIRIRPSTLRGLVLT